MKIVVCDLHAKQQTIAVVDTNTGELIERTLSHEGSAVVAFPILRLASNKPAQPH